MRHFKDMKVFCLMILGLFALGIIVKAQEGQHQKSDDRTIKLMTYNLKFASPTFEPPWSVRRDWQVDLIHKYSPDIIGTQEGLKEQVDYLMDHLPEYVVIGEGRKGGDDDEHMAIFFKRDRFRLREMGSFQLSETPEVLV
jgi:endonuclease/exonuclease/phosphatase family metal-dependent hydrolase